jgi:group I intron endonuclease
MSSYTVYLVSFPNSKRYVGITKKILSIRKSEHLSCSKKPRLPFHKALSKYKDEVVWSILHEGLSKQEAVSFEQKYIIEFASFISSNGYNCTSGGDGISDYKKTPEQIQKWREATKETFSSADYRARMSLTKKHPTEEQRLNISKGQRKRFDREEERTALRNRVKESHSKDEVKKNISTAQKERFSRLEEVSKAAQRTKEYIQSNYESWSKSMGYREVLAFDSEGNFVGEFINTAKCAEGLNLQRSSISLCLNGKKPHCKKYTFKFKEQ